MRQIFQLLGVLFSDVLVLIDHSSLAIHTLVEREHRKNLRLPTATVSSATMFRKTFQIATSSPVACENSLSLNKSFQYTF